MHAESQPTSNAAVSAQQHHQHPSGPRRLWDFQARLHIAGHLSDEEFQRLISQHLRATHLVVEPRQEPGIAEHVLPEGWRRAS